MHFICSWGRTTSWEIDIFGHFVHYCNDGTGWRHNGEIGKRIIFQLLNYNILVNVWGGRICLESCPNWYCAPCRPIRSTLYSPSRMTDVPRSKPSSRGNHHRITGGWSIEWIIGHRGEWEGAVLGADIDWMGSSTSTTGILVLSQLK